MEIEVFRLFSVAETKTELIRIAHELLIQDTTPEQAAADLIEIAQGMHQEETVLFKNCIEKSLPHPDQGSAKAIV